MEIFALAGFAVVFAIIWGMKPAWQAIRDVIYSIRDLFNEISGWG